MVLEIVTLHSRDPTLSDSFHPRHPRIAIRIDEIDLPIHEDLVVVPAAHTANDAE